MSALLTHLHIFELEKPIRVVTDVRQIDLTKLEESGKLLGNILINSNIAEINYQLTLVHN